MVSRETVSRETSTPGPAPASIQALFPDDIPVLTRYAQLLATAGVERGLIGPREVPRLWERHLLNCAVVEELVPRDVTLADVGSGAGLPGVVLATVRPDLQVTLIEPLLRRATFLEEAVDTLGLGNVEVVRARAEELRGRTFTAVTARAVAPLPRLAGWCAPLITPGGWMLALKGDRAADELSAAAAELEWAGLREPRVVRVGPEDGARTTVVVMRKDGPTRPSTKRTKGAGRR